MDTSPQVTPQPAAGKGLALDPLGAIPSAVLSPPSIVGYQAGAVSQTLGASATYASRVWIPAPMRVKSFQVSVATSAGNSDVAILTTGGVRLWSRGTSTLATGQNSVAISAGQPPLLQLPSGEVFLAVATDNGAFAVYGGANNPKGWCKFVATGPAIGAALALSDANTGLTVAISSF